jgi:hypothetical protein
VLFSEIDIAWSGLFKDMEAANAVGNAIVFPIMFLSGTYFPLEIMPSYLQPISQALPLTYFSEGFKATMKTKFPETILLNLAVVGAARRGLRPARCKDYTLEKKANFHTSQEKVQAHLTHTETLIVPQRISSQNNIVKRKSQRTLNGNRGQHV